MFLKSLKKSKYENIHSGSAERYLYIIMLDNTKLEFCITFK